MYQEQNGAKMGFSFGGRSVPEMGFVLVLLQKGRAGIYPGCDVFPSPLKMEKKPGYSAVKLH